MNAPHFPRFRVVRWFGLVNAQATGSLKEMTGFAETCMADYDENGWTDEAYHDNADVSILKSLRESGD